MLIRINHKEIKLKVNNSIHTIPSLSVNENKKNAEDVVSTQAVSENAAGNAVHISSSATNLQTINTTAEMGSIVDMERVQEIKQAISDGVFKVNPEVITNRLIEAAKELISTKEGHS
jgi:negative regulator of flagellin synthesis FlgM